MDYLAFLFLGFMLGVASAAKVAQVLVENERRRSQQPPVHRELPVAAVDDDATEEFA